MNHTINFVKLSTKGAAYLRQKISNFNLRKALKKKANYYYFEFIELNI